MYFFCNAVAASKPWTPSTHAQLSISAQRSVHLVVAMLWQVRVQGRQMQVPYELVAAVLKHVV
jgi:hypothetical protein